jgi:hypothetical protein
MKLLSIAFDLEMFFFPVLVNFGVSKKKKRKERRKKTSQISHARANYRKREREI